MQHCCIASLTNCRPWHASNKFPHAQSWQKSLHAAQIELHGVTPHLGNSNENFSNVALHVAERTLHSVTVPCRYMDLPDTITFSLCDCVKIKIHKQFWAPPFFLRQNQGIRISRYEQTATLQWQASMSTLAGVSGSEQCSQRVGQYTRNS